MAMLRGSNKHTFVSTDARPYETKFHWPFILIKDLNLSTSARLSSTSPNHVLSDIGHVQQFFHLIECCCKKVLGILLIQGHIRKRIPSIDFCLLHVWERLRHRGKCWLKLMEHIWMKATLESPWLETCDDTSRFTQLVLGHGESLIDILQYSFEYICMCVQKKSCIKRQEWRCKGKR